jgi:hypothetical protein
MPARMPVRAEQPSAEAEEWNKIKVTLLCHLYVPSLWNSFFHLGVDVDSNESCGIDSDTANTL